MSVTLVPPTPGTVSGGVGRSIERSDIRAKLSGEAEYLADLPAVDALHVALLRSPVAHARIVRVDSSMALRLEGVVDVVVAEDLTGFDATWGHLVRDRPILADGVVRFAGEVVAAVVAESASVAAQAITLVDVDYEVLTPLVDVEVAAGAEAAAIHDAAPRPGFACPPGTEFRSGNDFYRYGVKFDRRDAGADNDLVVVEHEYSFPAVYQYAMEPHAVIARWEPGQITVQSSCQHPFLVREELATIFDLPVEAVRIRVPFVGGGFGSKSYAKMEPLAVAIARHVGRTVRIVNGVDDAMVTTRRHAMRCRMRTTARKNGRLVSREASILMDTGAYADNGPTVTMVAAMAGVGPYRWEAADVTASCVYTHLPPAGSYRGFGAAHLQWVGETQIDEIARVLGVDRLTFRCENLLTRGDEYIPGLRPVDADLAGDLVAAAERLGWPDQAGVGQGIGLAAGISMAGASPKSNARVELVEDGRVVVHSGTQEIGQGARTVHAQVAAEVLGVADSDVTVPATDTDVTPFDRSTGASRSTTVAGLAVMRASEHLAEVVLEKAAEQSGIALRDLHLVDGQVIGPGQAWALAEFAPATGIGAADELAAGLRGGVVFWEVCVAAARVRVDPLTGVVEVDEVVTVADVGKAINPSLVERQDEGCAMQSIGNALFEEMHFSDEGVLLNDTLMDYRVPTMHDVPRSMSCIIVENGDGPGPFGAKGCGEGVFGGLMAALVCAVHDSGAPVRALPMSPDRVWRARRSALSGSEG